MAYRALALFFCLCLSCFGQPTSGSVLTFNAAACYASLGTSLGGPLSIGGPLAIH